MRMKVVLAENVVDDTLWLEIENEKSNTKSVFLYFYQTENLAYDSWYQDINDALDYAFNIYGVKKEDWIKLED